MIKMNKSKGNKIETIKCPVCGLDTEVERLIDLKVDSRITELHSDVGFIIQCVNPDCAEYLEKIDSDFKLITKMDLIKRQLEITDFLAKEDDIARARLVPSVVEAEIVKAEAGRALSPLLFHLTADRPPVHRAYAVDEILEACRVIGFNPIEVGSRRIGFVLNWLKEHKG